MASSLSEMIPCKTDVKFFTCSDGLKVTKDWDVVRRIQKDILRPRGWYIGDWATLTRKYDRKHRLFQIESVHATDTIEGHYPSGKSVGCLYGFHRAIWIPTVTQLWFLLDGQRQIVWNKRSISIIEDSRRKAFRGATPAIALARALVTTL